MMQEEREGWVRWTPAVARSRGWEDLAEAVEDFRAPCEGAGSACERWLKEESLDEWPRTVTWVMFHAGLVQGFFAICSSSINITMPDGKKEMWPCSKIVWLSRRDRREGGKFKGQTLFMQAASRAGEVGEIQGNVALVIEPFDDRIAKLLELRHEFLRTANQGQLWLPLYAAGPSAPSARGE